MTEDEADQLLAKAIIDNAVTCGLKDPDGLLSAYAIVACWIGKDGKAQYTTQYHQSEIPDHEAIGLFTIGLDMVSSQEDDDD